MGSRGGMPGQSPPPLGLFSRSHGAGGTLAAYPSLASQKKAWGAVRGGQGRTTAAPGEGALAVRRRGSSTLCVSCGYQPPGRTTLAGSETEKRRGRAGCKPVLPVPGQGLLGFCQPQARGASLSGSHSVEKTALQSSARAFCHGMGQAGIQAGSRAGADLGPHGPAVHPAGCCGSSLRLSLSSLLYDKPVPVRYVSWVLWALLANHRTRGMGRGNP